MLFDVSIGIHKKENHSNQQELGMDTCILLIFSACLLGSFVQTGAKPKSP
jgi:hypothetical protein